jgi:predicted nuclease with RNAse H fold
MLVPESTFVGVEPAGGGKLMHYAALDADLHVVALEASDLGELLAFIGGLRPGVIALHAPRGGSQGAMAEPEVRRRYNLRPDSKRWREWRVAEFELRRRNIRLHPVASRLRTARSWVNAGRGLIRQLEGMGYRPLLLKEPSGAPGLLEVQPHACFTALLERRPFSRETLEGRMQRQLVLYMAGLDLQDPLMALEEITRHHMLGGHLPLEAIRQPEELDALAAAYTAYLVARKPERVTQLGERAEGVITVPVARLKDFYA